MKKELLDFLIWIDKNGIYIENGNLTETVNRYLKSINSAQGEISNVSDNEQSEEDCKGCYHIDTCKYALLNTICRHYIDNTQSD